MGYLLLIMGKLLEVAGIGFCLLGFVCGLGLWHSSAGSIFEQVSLLILGLAVFLAGWFLTQRGGVQDKQPEDQE